jgi:hypothetical protein
MSALAAFTCFANANVFNQCLPTNDGTVIVGKYASGCRVALQQGQSIRGQLRIVIDRSKSIADADLIGETDSASRPVFVCRATDEMRAKAGCDFAIFVGNESTNWSALDRYLVNHPSSEVGVF